ncbi:NADP oxidoreductase coenzyme f420-dependent (plasmid) [Rhizobium tropici CIAT 899]|nr:NADP oxidoreductase coenzyme f420-dependent [Rhizobium tropici CIAT 899]
MAIRFEQHPDIAKALPTWQGKTSDDDVAAAEVGALAERLGFAPIQLGRLSEGGLLVHAHGKSWGHLIFKDLVKFE